jgi:signal transduction histidine kinase
MVDNAFRHGDGRITLTACSADGRAELHVTDQGAGFPSSFVGRAFERFSRADRRAVDSTGLGLAIVETIARAHGGEAHAETLPRGGADVWISLPA